MKEVIFTWYPDTENAKNINITRKVFRDDVLIDVQPLNNIDPTVNFGECRVFNQDGLKFLFEKRLKEIGGKNEP